MTLASLLLELHKERNRAQDELNRIDAAAAALGSLNGSFKGVRTRKRKLTAAARRRIAVAQRARWAKWKANKSASTKAPIPFRSKRRISPAGLARIRAAQRARWAKLKKQKAA
jgi:hypothetical protein